MPQQIVQLVYPALVLFFVLFALIVSDRAFPLRVRRMFYLMLLTSLILVLMDGSSGWLAGQGFLSGRAGVGTLVVTMKYMLRPLILMFWIQVILRNCEKRRFLVVCLPGVLNLLLCLINLKTHWIFGFREDGTLFWGPLIPLPFLVLSFYFVLMAVLVIWEARKNDRTEIFLVFVILCTMVFASFMEFLRDYRVMLDHILGVGVCLYYFYLAMQEYRRDALTRVLNRHNFHYDLMDLRKKDYRLSLIDIDNFKMINDKYGHDKGDEALVSVVNAIRANLLPGCCLYRYGGDEFAVISRGVSEEKLEEMFVRINEELDKGNFRISYGTAEHLSGSSAKETLLHADAAMYANKRQLKSENIWDDMTGLFNLRGFLDELEDLSKRARKEQKRICLVSMDIEHLSNINRAYGYSEGNAIIATLAKIVFQSLNPGEFAGHLGSDEFVTAMLVSGEDEEYQKEYMKGIQNAVDNSLELSEKDYTVELNFGMGYIDLEAGMSVEKCVNSVLYSKQAEKDNRRKSVYSPAADYGQDYNEEEDKQVVDIIRNNRLKYAFQPIVSAVDGKIVAYEALMRSDTEPMVSPLTILKYASRNHMTYDIEKLTFSNVLSEMDKAGEIFRNRRLFINSIPGFLLTDEDFQQNIARYRELTGQMVIEITEQRELEDEALQIIHKRQELTGFRLAIDDFGSGCSNTNSLLRYMPEVIKLDRLLISGIDSNTKKQYFVSSIITFAHTNSMSVLAEGVETEAELRMVIRLGVDLIQGYYTAKPAYEFLEEIPAQIRNTICAEHNKIGVASGRKVYLVSMEREVSLVHLAMQDYTEITVTTPELRIQGSLDFTADMTIRIKDGLHCVLTINDVRLHSVDDLPCIEVGEGSVLTLVLEGENTLNATGIHVPEGGMLITKGTGKLSINAKGHDCFGIGCPGNESVGSLYFRHSGTLAVNVDGEDCAAIGGGVYRYGNGISAESGAFEIGVAGVNAVGIGCFSGDMPIKLVDCSIQIDFHVNSGSAVGTIQGQQRIYMKNFKLLIGGSGSRLSAVGCNHASDGTIQMAYGGFVARLSGQDICLLGVESGPLQVNLAHVGLQLVGEGNNVIAVGSMDEQASIHLEQGSSSIRVNAANAKVFGAKEENLEILDPSPDIHVNE